MPGRYLLDTNAVIALFGDEENLKAMLGGSTVVFLSDIVLGELFFGAEKSHQVAVNISRIERFAAECNVLSVDTDVARSYGRIKRQLKSEGRPIPENDIWIAATAMAHGLGLLTRDQHFLAVKGINSVGW